MTQEPERVVLGDIDDVLSTAAAHVAWLILRMKPGETLTIIRREDGPDAIRLKGGRV